MLRVVNALCFKGYSENRQREVAGRSVNFDENINNNYGGILSKSDNIIDFSYTRGKVLKRGLWLSHKLSFKRDEEVGGILLGTIDKYKKDKFGRPTFEVKMILQFRNTAKKSTRAVRYKLPKAGIINMIRGMWWLMRTKWVVLGEWHSHLVPPYGPSNTDKVQMTKRSGDIDRLREMLKKWNGREFVADYWVLGISDREQRMRIYQF